MVEIKNEQDQEQVDQQFQEQQSVARDGKNTTKTLGGYNTLHNNRSLEPEHLRKLFIGGLSLATTDESLSQFYSQFGKILDCVVMRDQVKKSRGFGFISFSSSEELDRAMSSRPHEIDGKTVDPKRAVPRDKKSESNISTKRLYVSGVREEHTEELFEKYFSEFGTVTKVEIIPDKATGKPRGFAFVNFEDYDTVDKCVLQKSHMIYGYRCDVKKALSKDEIARASQMDRDKEMRGGRSRGQREPYGPISDGYNGDGGRWGQWGGPPGPQAGQWNAPQWGTPGYGYGYGAPSAGYSNPGGYGGYGGYGPPATGSGYGSYGAGGPPPATGSSYGSYGAGGPPPSTGSVYGSYGAGGPPPATGSGYGSYGAGGPPPSTGSVYGSYGAGGPPPSTGSGYGGYGPPTTAGPWANNAGPTQVAAPGGPPGKGYGASQESTSAVTGWSVPPDAQQWSTSAPNIGPEPQWGAASASPHWK